MKCQVQQAATSALLGLIRLSAFVPRAVALPVLPLDSTAHPGSPVTAIKFNLDTSSAAEHISQGGSKLEVVKIVVGTGQPCGQTNITFNGKQLDTAWSGTVIGSGSAALGADPSEKAFWQVVCIPSGTPTGSHVQLLRLGWQEILYDTFPSFSLSFTQSHTPSIHRFEPFAHSNGDEESYDYWSTYDLGKAQAAGLDVEVETSFIQRTKAQSAMILTSIQHIKASVTKTVQASLRILPCDKVQEFFHSGSKGHPSKSSKQEIQEPGSQKIGINVPTIDRISMSGLTNMEENLASSSNTIAASSVNSISLIEADSRTEEQHVNESIALVKVFPAVFIVALVLAWLCVCRRDPRRRADRAARREEKKRKRLFRQAERRQKFRNMVGKVRVRFGYTATEQVTWAEKFGNEAALEEQASDRGADEALVKDDIRAFRQAHRLVSALMNQFSTSDLRPLSIASGESLSNHLEQSLPHLHHTHQPLMQQTASRQHYYRPYSANSGRSSSSLPDYETDDAHAPPAYTIYQEYQIKSTGRRKRRDSEGGSSTEGTTGSSVISTSPRISTATDSNVDPEEKIEDFQLGAAYEGDCLIMPSLGRTDQQWTTGPLVPLAAAT